jgi:hypothetical protein
MPGDFLVPDAVWDHTKQTCYDPSSNDPLPNYEGLALVTHPHSMVMNTWLEGGERRWDFVCMGWHVPNRVLKKAS